MDMYSLTTETGDLLVAGGLNPLYIEDVIENTILEVIIAITNIH